MNLSRCGLWIDLSLILNFKKPAADSYRRLGIDRELVDTFAHDVPWEEWLRNSAGEPSHILQVARDTMLGLHLSENGLDKTSHRAGFSFAKLFEEAGGRVAIASHETEETTKAFAHLLGFKDPEIFPSRSRSLAHEAFKNWDRTGLEFAYVLERGVHLNAEKKIVQQLADKGVLINVKSTEQLNTTINGLHYRIVA